MARLRLDDRRHARDCRQSGDVDTFRHDSLDEAEERVKNWGRTPEFSAGAATTRWCRRKSGGPSLIFPLIFPLLPFMSRRYPPFGDFHDRGHRPWNDKQPRCDLAGRRA